MDFKTFLNESKSDGKYKTKISLSDAVEIFKKNCRDMDIDSPFWRGMRSTTKALTLEGQRSNRDSISSIKFHNIFIDELIKESGKNYPLRSASIIAIGNDGESDARGFGDQVYAIYPFDGVIIGKCNDADILRQKLNHDHGDSYIISDLNYELSQMGNVGRRTSPNMETVAESIYKRLQKGVIDDEFKKVFGTLDLDVKGIIAELKKYYSLDNFDFVTSKKTSDHGDEIWVGGECLAIHIDHLDEFKEMF